ncbi:MAG: CoA pyrophosphatase [Pseudomonadota bacterium]
MSEENSAPLAALRVRLAGTQPGLAPQDMRLPGGASARVLRQRIGDGERLRRSAVLVPLVDRPEEPTVLLTKRSEELKHHAGQISFPGGRIEASDRGPLEAALRETHEEVGITADQVDVLGYLDTYVTGTGFSIVPVVGVVQPFASLRLDQVEVAAAFEVPLSFLVDPDNRRMVAREVFGERVEFYEWQYQQHRIWGATAGIIVGLGERFNIHINQGKSD